VICDLWEVVVVPFPFTDKPDHKRRPALVLSRRAFNQAGHSILAMITSIVRLKLFTLDNHLIMRPLGRLSSADRSQLQNALRIFFAGAE